MDNPREVDSTFYDAHYFEPHISRIENGARFWHYLEINIQNLVNPRPNEHILDLGCGVGSASIVLSRDTNLRITMIDYSEIAIKEARRAFRIFAMNKTIPNFIVADATKLPIRSSIFDKIVMVDFVEHVTQPIFDRVLEQCEYVLKPHGDIYIYTPNPYHLFEWMKKIKILKMDKSHVDVKTMRRVIKSLVLHNFVITESYSLPSHVPLYSQLEKVLGHIPLISGLFQRRFCVVAQRI